MFLRGPSCIILAERYAVNPDIKKGKIAEFDDS